MLIVDADSIEQFLTFIFTYELEEFVDNPQ